MNNAEYQDMPAISPHWLIEKLLLKAWTATTPARIKEHGRIGCYVYPHHKEMLN